MNEYLSAIIIAVITGAFSIISLLIQKKSDRVVDKIDEKGAIIKKEKSLKQQLHLKERERERLIHDMTLLILETNINILENTDANSDSIDMNEIKYKSNILKVKFNELTAAINELNKQYELVLDLSHDFQDNSSEEKKV